MTYYVRVRRVRVNWWNLVIVLYFCRSAPHLNYDYYLEHRRLIISKGHVNMANELKIDKNK